MASADIKPLGCACLFAMLLLIGPTLFHTPGVFVYIYMHCKYVGKISQTLIANDSNLLVAYMHSTSVYSLIGLMKPLRTAILAI